MFGMSPSVKTEAAPSDEGVVRNEVLATSVGLATLAAMTAQLAPAQQRRPTLATASCVRVMVPFRDGRLRPMPAPPTPMPAPPTPKLTATRSAAHAVRFVWRFPRSIPTKCQPKGISLTVLHKAPYTPTTILARVRGASGSATVKEPSFVPPGQTGLASAYTARGLYGTLVHVSIRR